MTRKRVVHHPGLAWTAALAGAWLAAVACRSLQTVPGVPSAGPVAETAADGLAPFVPAPRIRVGVAVGVDEVRVEAPSGVVVRGRAAGERAVLVRPVPVATFVPGPSAGELQLVETGDRLERAAVLPAGAGERLRTGAGEFRGALEVLPAEGGRLTAVNEVNLEDYLRGVVPNELAPEAFPQIEAQKAQAVAARTYAMAHLGDYSARGYDVCATAACQVYRGVGSEHPLTDRAVAETAGVVATWRGRPIKAYYTSTCGGHTEDGRAIFEDRAPYLRGVTCRGSADPDGPDAPGRGAADHEWQVRLTPAQVARAVGRYGSVGEVRDLVPRRLGVSGRVIELAVVGSEGELDLRGARVRWGLGLRENPFSLDRETGPGGEATEFVITGRGWGHGVGLCQIGASAMARHGSSFEAILKHYYTGVSLGRL